jgi:cell shape-determining protein MreC
MIEPAFIGRVHDVRLFILIVLLILFLFSMSPNQAIPADKSIHFSHSPPLTR